jgi:two-component system, NarL family, sensor kinase
LLYYVYYQRLQRIKQKQKLALLEKEKQLATIDALLQGQEEERRRLAKELHDGLGGMLSGLKWSFNSVKEHVDGNLKSEAPLNKYQSQLDASIEELRKVSHSLMPDVLIQLGLFSALEEYCTNLKLTSKKNIVFQSLGSERSLNNTATLYIYRIFQELINNSFKHANANNMLCQLTMHSNKILLSVEDDGIGFNLTNKGKGIGFTNVQQRVEYLNGKMDIESDIGKGAVINIELNI